MNKEIQPNWYKIKGIWYHCITTENGDRYVNGEKQNRYELIIQRP
jgi:hypothetical protein